MKKHISVFGLFARSSLYKILGILIVMSTVEIIFFHLELQEALTAYEVVGSEMATLERLFSRSATNVYFAVALVLTTVSLCLSGCQFKSHTSYTLRRLSVSERATFFCQAAYNTLAYVILATVQLAIAFGLCQYYLTTVPAETVSNQTLFLAFYRSEFLHALLPLEDVGLWIRNGLLALSLGLASAEFPYKQRRKKYAASILALVMYTIVYFERGIGDLFHLITVIIITLMIVGEMLYTVVKKEAEEDTRYE